MSLKYKYAIKKSINSIRFETYFLDFTPYLVKVHSKEDKNHYTYVNAITLIQRLSFV